jgi:hypothetical protein
MIRMGGQDGASVEVVRIEGERPPSWMWESAEAVVVRGRWIVRAGRGKVRGGEALEKRRVVVCCQVGGRVMGIGRKGRGGLRKSRWRMRYVDGGIYAAKADRWRAIALVLIGRAINLWPRT